MSVDQRPTYCRFRLEDEGKPFPKSSCSHCGLNVGTGLGKSCKFKPNPIETVAKGEHTVHMKFGSVVYWRDGVACGQFEQWTHCEIFVVPNNSGVTDFRFERSDMILVDATIRALGKAFDNGKRARSREIKALIENTGFGV